MLTRTLALGRIRQHHGMGGFTTSNGSVKDGHGNLLVKSRYDLTIADLAYLSIDTACGDAEVAPDLVRLLAARSMKTKRPIRKDWPDCLF